MKSKQMLQMMATRCLEGGPMKRRQDARTILAMSSELDEEAARTYLERFVRKWELGEPSKRMPAPVRRRPMAPLEQRVHASLARPEEAKTAVLVIDVPAR
ncbi:MAG: hypothetical protein AAGI01_06750 [Myxococcota bacterium]